MPETPFSSTQMNPWFGLSMALVGVIVGYGIAIASGAGGLPGMAPTPAAPSPVAGQPTAQAPQPDDFPPVDTDGDHIRGNRNAEISVIEYSDFQCPFCQRHHPTMKAILDTYGDDVNWVYRHYPLSIHANAQISAEASECVYAQGGDDAFWEYVDILFEKGTEPSMLADFAEDVGVNRATFETCLENETYASKVNSQMADGTAAGVRGTPGNAVVNNRTGETLYISGAQPLQSFQTAIDQLLDS